MPSALTFPGVYIEEIPSGVRTITGVATSITLFIGWAPRGPIDRALRLTSFADYERQYGGLDRRALLGYSVKHFYDNGGADVLIVNEQSDRPEDSFLQLLLSHPSLKVFVLTQDGRNATLLEFRRARLADASPTTLIEAIRSVLRRDADGDQL